MKKKIFFIMSTDDYSGAEAVNFSIIDGLKDKYDFYWVSKKGNINSYLEEKNIKWIEISKLSPKEIRRVVKEYHPDILHATDYNASFVASISSLGKPVISHIHNNALWIKKINLKSIIFLFTALRVKKIITVSPAIQNEFIFSRFIAKKIVCLYNPISYKKIIDAVKGKKIQKKYDICCCARLSEPKDPIRFIRIIHLIKKELHNVNAIWIGDGELKSTVIEEARKYGVENNIDFVGKKQNPYEYIASARLFLLTSKWEGFGLAAYEAISLGLPAVVTNVGGLPYIVDENCGFLCETDDEMVHGIKILLSDEKKYNTYSSNAINKAIKINNSESYMNDLKQVYLDIIKK